ncbi:hypothetical protein [Helicobacter himalayensis]|uniref:hypothetical protein n=1 Tax=Helicobacter himalayensis TaxID=1591088 RepID=UPI003D6EC77D
MRPVLKLINPLRKKIDYLRTKNLSDEEYFLRRHQNIFGYTPDFKNPKTFNEKIIHRMLFDRNPIYTALADKLKARIYIATKLQNLEFPNRVAESTNLKASKKRGICARSGAEAEFTTAKRYNLNEWNLDSAIRGGGIAKVK